MLSDETVLTPVIIRNLGNTRAQYPNRSSQMYNSHLIQFIRYFYSRNPQTLKTKSRSTNYVPSASLLVGALNSLSNIDIFFYRLLTFCCSKIVLVNTILTFSCYIFSLFTLYCNGIVIIITHKKSSRLAENIFFFIWHILRFVVNTLRV